MAETLESYTTAVEGLVSVEVWDTQAWVVGVLCLEQLYVTSNVCDYVSASPQCFGQCTICMHTAEPPLLDTSSLFALSFTRMKSPGLISRRGYGC